MDSKQTKEFYLESKNGEKRKNKNGPQPSSYEPFLKVISKLEIMPGALRAQS